MKRLWFSAFYCALVLGPFSVMDTQAGWFEDFEGDDPLFGFTMEERGGSYGLTENIDVLVNDLVLDGSRSVFLSESWDRVTRELGITEGIVTVWFRDSDYRGYEANSVRLRTGEEDSITPGWPLDFTTVELRGQRSGHGGGDIHNYYVARPCEECSAMGVEFGYDLMTGASIARATDRWNEVSFLMEDGQTLTSINNHPSTLIVTTPLTQIELLCRSGWYQTRGGEAQVMLVG